MMLSTKQLSRFQHDGFLLLSGFADIKQCNAILRAAREEMAKMAEPIETEGEYKMTDNLTLRRLRQVYDRRAEFRDWMTNDAIRPILEQVLGEKAVLTLAHHNSIMTKMPLSSSETCWHQDRRYWQFENDNLVSVWLALDEERMENGVLEFIPGSHKPDFGIDQFDAKSCFLHKPPKNAKLIAKRVHFDLNPGDVVLFHCRTLHHAFSNKTDKPKISFVYTVRGAGNKPLPGTRSSAFAEIVLG